MDEQPDTQNAAPKTPHNTQSKRQRSDLIKDLFSTVKDPRAVEKMFKHSKLSKTIRQQAEQETLDQKEAIKSQPVPTVGVANEEGTPQRRPLLVRGIVV